MMNRADSALAWAPSRWSDWRRGLSARQAAMVRRYVLLVAVLSALGCLYLWQLNAITDMRQETWKLLKRAEDIEGSNAYLMQQLAQWESPAYIERQARALGWRKAGAPAYVQVPAAPPGEASTAQAGGLISWLAAETSARTVR